MKANLLDDVFVHVASPLERLTRFTARD